jgi:hypothetical protein
MVMDFQARAADGTRTTCLSGVAEAAIYASFWLNLTTSTFTTRRRRVEECSLPIRTFEQRGCEMVYVRVAALTLLMVLSLELVYSQEPKGGTKKEEPMPKLRGQLPQNFKKLGLRDDQIQMIYKIQADYKAKMEELDRQLKKLKSERDEAIQKVLTPEQLKRLRELRTGEKSSGS